MSMEDAETKKGGGLKWPICTLLIVLALGSLIYYGYTQFQAEQAMIAARRSTAQAPPAGAVGQPPAGAYRGGLPFFLIAGFGGVMATILGGILYLWWSLKDWEGGRRYGDEEPPDLASNNHPGEATHKTAAKTTD